MGANCSQYCMTDEKRTEFDIEGYTSNGTKGEE